MITDIGMAVSGDIPEIAEIEKEAFSDPWTADGLMRELENPLGIFLCCHDDRGSVLGYIAGSCDEYGGYIEKAAVSSAARRRGVGNALLDGFFRTAAKRSAKTVSLDVRESNGGARRFYLNYGFREEGTRRNFYSSPRENAVIMIMDVQQRKEEE
ncbi:MAG: ribosomal protein S18-alanine N-acetyltransferase [Huintestinicola sp.]